MTKITYTDDSKIIGYQVFRFHVEDLCCEEMKELIAQKSVYPLDGKLRIIVYDYDSEDSINEMYIHFCPFCGQKIKEYEK